MRPHNAPNNNRRSFLKGSLAIAGATALTSSDMMAQRSTALTNGDSAILKFLAAIELIEADLWQQYAELGGVTQGAQNPYQNALQQLDGDGSQYITSNTLDEISHAKFLNAYLVMRGQEPVDLDQYRTLPSSQATGAQQIGRLTNLTQLSVDTSWYTRYRSSTNPDFGATYAQALPALSNGVFSAIPKTDSELSSADHAQALANISAFHFGSIEQGGSSLYPTLAQHVSDVEVLRILLSIGGDEVAHFLEWVDFAGNGVQTPIAPFTDPITGLAFPDFNAANSPLLQTNLIFPVPCEFINATLPQVAVLRPTGPGEIDAVGAVTYFTASGLFIGQNPSFVQVLTEMALAADAAVRGR
jgi:hypothetical protein